MKIGVTSSDGNFVDLHLGKASTIYIFNFDCEDEIEFDEIRRVNINPNEKHQGTLVLNAIEDCEVVITAQYGFTSKMDAEDKGIKLIQDDRSVDDALKGFLDHYLFMKKPI